MMSSSLISRQSQKVLEEGKGILSLMAFIVFARSRIISCFRYASIGAVLMSPKIADGIRDHSGLWKHGHTYQACPNLFFSNSNLGCN